jgi:hypothetical protein
VITVTYINDNLERLKTFLETCGLLNDETVTLATETAVYMSGPVDVLKILDAQENVLFRLEHAKNGSNHTYEYAACISSGSYSLSGTTYYHRLVEAAGCKNGASIRFEGTGSLSNLTGCLRIVRNNLGKLVFIYNTSGSSISNSVDLCCISWDDVLPFRTVTIRGHNRMTAVVAPMFTNAAFDTLSYTAKSGFLPYSRGYTCYFRALTINGHRFLNDGYFAIEDEG